jgi:hypothetical protein
MNKSKFVTSLGWFSIALSLLLAILAGFEVFAYGLLSSQPEMAIQLGISLQSKTGQFVDIEQLPQQIMQQALGHGLLACIGFPTAIGLLRRKDWARKITLVLIIGATLSAAPQLLWKPLPASLPRWLAVSIFALVLLVHGKIIRRLMRPEVRAEFQVRPLVG